MKDINGKRFGSLIVIERAGKTGKVQLVKCKCDCGKETIVRYPNLISGITTSCGCIKRKRTSQRKLKDLKGKQFGELTVIKRASAVGGKKVLWLCKCSCGHTCIVAGSNLKSGNTTSCGCMSVSLNEGIIVHLLNKYNINYEKEAKFADLLSPNRKPLRFDFKIFTKSGFFLLEYQGLQHYQFEFGDKGFGSFARKYSDKIKREYCKNNKLVLEEITYKDNTEKTLLNILKKYNLLHDNTVPSVVQNSEGVTTIP